MGVPRVIAVDVDDVLSDHAAGFVEFSNKRWGTHLSVNDYDEHWAHMWQIDDEETEARAKEFHTSGAVSLYRHNEAALPVLRTLSEGFKIIIVTSRRAMIEKETRAWVTEHYPDIFSEVHFSGIWNTTDANRHLRTKAEICQSLGAGYLIDDQLKHCTAAALIGIKSLLFGEYTWNQAAKLPEDVTRVKDWDAIRRYFENQ